MLALRLIELRFYIQLDTKQLISEMLFSADLLASTEKAGSPMQVAQKRHDTYVKCLQTLCQWNASRLVNREDNNAFDCVWTVVTVGSVSSLVDKSRADWCIGSCTAHAHNYHWLLLNTEYFLKKHPLMSWCAIISLMYAAIYTVNQKKNVAVYFWL